MSGLFEFVQSVEDAVSFLADSGTLKVEIDNCLQADDVDEFVVCLLIPSQTLLTLKKPQFGNILDSLGLTHEVAEHNLQSFHHSPYLQLK